MGRRPVADDLGDVGAATAWVRQQVAEAVVGEDVLFAIEICVEEALVNLIQHGRPADDVKDIAIAVDVDPPGATVLVTDRCLPFDSAAAPAPKYPAPNETMAGGHGLTLMRAFSSELTYESTRSGNELTMRFRPPA